MPFCAIPWVHRFTNEQGYHQLCCNGCGAANQLSDSEGHRLHVSQKLTDEQFLNSSDLKAVRRQMRAGEWPSACERCRQREEASGSSIRQFFNTRYAQGREAEMLAELEEDGSLSGIGIRSADIRLGNVCNLTCRMCHPSASRLWAPHWNRVQPKTHRIPETELTIIGQNNWVKRDSVSWLLQQCLPTLENLHFAGGEPMIVPEMIEALEWCIDSGRAGEIDLSYNTNLTVLPQKVTELWPHFRSVALLCSVDAFGCLNDYVRRPSKWSAIDENLHRVDANFAAWKVKWIALSATVQIFNALSLPDLFSYLRSAGFENIERLPQLISLMFPPYLSVQALPHSVKLVVRERLQREIQTAEASRTNDPSDHLGTIRSTIAFMDAADTSEDLGDFFAFAEASDREFGDSWRDAAPELAMRLRDFENVAATPSQRAKTLDARVYSILSRHRGHALVTR